MAKRQARKGALRGPAHFTPPPHIEGFTPTKEEARVTFDEELQCFREQVYTLAQLNTPWTPESTLVRSLLNHLPLLVGSIAEGATRDALADELSGVCDRLDERRVRTDLDDRWRILDGATFENGELVLP
jgi:hypothetical protein